jgi:Endomembrane protein 70
LLPPCFLLASSLLPPCFLLVSPLFPHHLNQEDAFYLYNHLNFTVTYTVDANDHSKFYVYSFTVNVSSIAFPDAAECSKKGDYLPFGFPELNIYNATTINWAYSVYFVNASEDASPSDRWNQVSSLMTTHHNTITPHTN